MTHDTIIAQTSSDFNSYNEAFAQIAYWKNEAKTGSDLGQTYIDNANANAIAWANIAEKFRQEIFDHKNYLLHAAILEQDQNRRLDAAHQIDPQTEALLAIFS